VDIDTLANGYYIQNIDVTTVIRNSTPIYIKGRTDMTTTSERLPVVSPASNMPGPRQGQWKYNDYAALPDDGQHYEIVNGVLYMTPSPSIAHQEAAFEIASYLRAHVKSAGLGRVFMSPVDVELAADVVVQPDVIVLLNKSLGKITTTRIIGAPELVVEVASPSTSGYDRREKQDAYARAGVLEYWVVNTDARTVEVLVLEAGVYHSLAVFQGTAILPSQVLPGFAARVEQFFA
jgi:Uma2 family endonuclease